MIELPRRPDQQDDSIETAFWHSLDLGSIGGAPVDLIISTCAASATVPHPRRLDLFATGTWILSEGTWNLSEAVERVEVALRG
ncbi:MAG: hypothetical protein EBZ48_04375 [Proteobacteria bacterium]|nr:hypothetical protein [Pseudomonadota bacterium]